MKIKLRDLTKEQYDKWESKNCKITTECKKCIFANVDCDVRNSFNWIYNKDLYSDKFLDQVVEIDDDDILNKKEKEYLKNVLKPFKDRISYIKKYILSTRGKEYIDIKFIDNSDFFMPLFDEKTMYKGMVLYKQYTLDDLGLYEGDKNEN